MGAVLGSPKRLYTSNALTCASGCGMGVSELVERGSQPGPWMLLITSYLPSLSKINVDSRGVAVGVGRLMLTGDSENISRAKSMYFCQIILETHHPC